MSMIIGHNYCAYIAIFSSQDFIESVVLRQVNSSFEQYHLLKNAAKKDPPPPKRTSATIHISLKLVLME